MFFKFNTHHYILMKTSRTDNKLLLTNEQAKVINRTGFGRRVIIGVIFRTKM